MKPILVVEGRQSDFAPIYKKKRLAQNFRLRRLETYNDDMEFIFYLHSNCERQRAFGKWHGI